jgi:Peduoviridae DNA primase
MASIEQLKQDIDLHDLAERLGLERGKGSNANYKSPHHADKNPSLAIDASKGFWKDFSSDDGGSCIDLVMYVRNLELPDALSELHEMYGYEKTQNKSAAPQRKSTIEYIADRCLENPKLSIPYLKDERKISEKVITQCINRKTLGFNTWTSPKVPKGDTGYGGKAAAFISRCSMSNRVVSVDMRFLDPSINGGLKTQSQGEKNGNLYVPDPYALKKAHTVFVVEAPINALSLMTAFENQAGHAAVAIKGTNNIGIDWTILLGKKVIICMDNDEPNEKGYRPGPEAAWRIHEEMLAVNVCALLVDQLEWEVNDANDYLKELGESELRIAAKKTELWAIPGLVGKEDEPKPYKRRVYLPTYDFKDYWKFHAQADQTLFQRVTTNEQGEKDFVSDPVCGFRVAGLSKITIQSATATTSGEEDAQPTRLFAASVQTPRHGNELQRRVLTDEQVHNIDQWKKFGPIFKPANMSRLLNLWERAVHIGERNAMNFVGLAFKDGRPTVNDGADCYFSDPIKQCPYHNLRFHNGYKGDAKPVVEAYQKTFKDNAAMMLLAWGVGAHMKAYLGFWPHMMLQADKGSGKTTLLDRLQRTLTFTMFSGQSLQTEFRLLTSISHTSHPVGWEEISARRKDIIDKAVSLLQECYGFTLTRRGSDMMEYLNAAPVLLAGEDVPVESILGKVVRSDINEKMGPMLPDNLPRWPMRKWIEFLASVSKSKVKELFEETKTEMVSRCMSKGDDPGSDRIIINYSALVMSWRLICEFAGIDTKTGGFFNSTVKAMNIHIKETKASRQPWVWILEIILNEIDSNNIRFSYAIDTERESHKECLFIRCSHIMAHLSQTPALKEKYNALPIKTARIFKQQLIRAGVVAKDDVERTISRQRVAHLTAIDLDKLEDFGLFVGRPDVIGGKVAV